MNKRGVLTDGIQKKAISFFNKEMSTRELRLIPYLQHLTINQKEIDIKRVSGEELQIINEWCIEGYISLGKTKVEFSKEFWDFCSEVMWLGYANFQNEEN